MEREKIIKRLMELEPFSKEFLENGFKRREKVREKFGKNIQRELIDLHMFIEALIFKMVKENANKPVQTNEILSHRISISTAFIQGFGEVYDPISRGYYIHAVCLVRQELEMLARLAELRSGKLGGKKPPNVRNVGLGLSRQYGELSEVSHIACDISSLLDVVNIPEQNICGPSIYPTYIHESALVILQHHLAIMLVFLFEYYEILKDMYGEALVNKYDEFLKIIFSATEGAGLIKGNLKAT